MSRKRQQHFCGLHLRNHLKGFTILRDRKGKPLINTHIPERHYTIGGNKKVIIQRKAIPVLRAVPIDRLRYTSAVLHEIRKDHR